MALAFQNSNGIQNSENFLSHEQWPSSWQPKSRDEDKPVKMHQKVPKRSSVQQADKLFDVARVDNCLRCERLGCTIGLSKLLSDNFSFCFVLFEFPVCLLIL